MYVLQITDVPLMYQRKEEVNRRGQSSEKVLKEAVKMETDWGSRKARGRTILWDLCENFMLSNCK
jgi:hypothetical protein